jgi:hypothetical protein
MSALSHFLLLLQIYLSFQLIKLDGQMEQNVINAVNFILNGPAPEIPKTKPTSKPKVTIVIPV